MCPVGLMGMEITRLLTWQQNSSRSIPECLLTSMAFVSADVVNALFRQFLDHWSLHDKCPTILERTRTLALNLISHSYLEGHLPRGSFQPLGKEGECPWRTSQDSPMQPSCRSPWDFLLCIRRRSGSMFLLASDPDTNDIAGKTEELFPYSSWQWVWRYDG